MKPVERIVEAWNTARTDLEGRSISPVFFRVHRYLHAITGVTFDSWSDEELLCPCRMDFVERALKGRESGSWLSNLELHGREIALDSATSGKCLGHSSVDQSGFLATNCSEKGYACALLDVVDRCWTTGRKVAAIVGIGRGPESASRLEVEEMALGYTQLFVKMNL
nr:hypothetical protein Iba_chr04bCG15970 [Ipomoea batatas]